MARVVHRHGMRIAMWDVSASDGPHRRSPTTSSQRVLRVGAQRLDHRPARRPRRHVGRRPGRRSSTRCPLILDGLHADAPAAGAARPARRRPRVHVVQRRRTADPRAACTPATAPTRRPTSVPGGNVVLALLVAAWIVVLALYLDHSHRAVVRQHEQLRARLVDRTRSLAPRTAAVAHAGARSRRRVRVPLRVRQLDDRRAALAAVRQLGRDAGTRARRGRLHRRDVRRVPRAAATAGGPRRCSPTRRSSRRCCSASSRSRGARCCSCSASRAGGAAAGSRRRSSSASGRRPTPRSCCRSGCSLVAACLPFAPDRRALLRWYALSLVIALPAVVLVFASPGYADSSTARPARELLRHARRRASSSSRCRSSSCAPPHRHPRARAARARARARRATSRSQEPLNVGVPVAARSRATAPTRRRSTTYLRSPQFVPGATYRVLRGPATASSACTTCCSPAGGSTPRCSPRAWRSAASRTSPTTRRCCATVTSTGSSTTTPTTRARHTNELAMIERSLDAAAPVDAVHARGRVASGTGLRRSIAVDSRGLPRADAAVRRRPTDRSVAVRPATRIVAARGRPEQRGSTSAIPTTRRSPRRSRPSCTRRSRPGCARPPATTTSPGPGSRRTATTCSASSCSRRSTTTAT